MRVKLKPFTFVAMTPNQIQAALVGWNACGEARRWAEGKDLRAIYASERGDWLYWLLPRIKAPKNLCVQLAVDAARLALPHAGELHRECLEAIEAAEAWLADPSEANLARCKGAADAALAAAADAADAAAFTAADAALAEAFRARISYAEFERLFTLTNQ